MRRISLLCISLLFLAALAKADADGCHANYVRPGSPAEQAGLKIGDFVVAVDSHPVHGFADLRDAIEHAGAQAQIDLVRAGQPQQLQVTLPPPNPTTPRLGLSCADAENTPVVLSTPVATPPAVEACPFTVPLGQKVRVQLADGRVFSGKLAACDSRVSLRSFILYRSFEVGQVKAITPEK